MLTISLRIDVVYVQGIAVSVEDIAITPGNSAALGMLFSNHRLRKRRKHQGVPSAVVEHPTYFLARDMLLDAGVGGRGCEIDGEGLQIDRLRELCEADGPPDYVYVNPNFHNVSVVSMRRVCRPCAR